MSESSKSDRRGFLRTVGLAGVTSALALPALTRGPAAQAPSAPTPTPAPAASDSARAAAPPPIGEDARALAGIIERRYGANLTKEQLESVARDFDGDLKATQRLREVKLGNAVEPDFTFRA